MFKNAISWFEIPVSDFSRAQKFYSAIFDYEMPVMEMGPVKMGFLLHDQNGGGIGGAICAGEGYVPSATGPKVYLFGGKDLNTVLQRVEKAGGKVVVPKMLISTELGHFAGFSDTEGNMVYLHSMD